MRKLLTSFVLAFVLCLQAGAQVKKLTYALMVKVDPDDVVQDMLEHLDKDSASRLMQQELKMMMEQGFLSQLVVWREGDEVVSVEPGTGEGKIYKYYNVHSLQYKVVDSLTYRKLGKVDSLVTSMDYRRFRGWKVSYSIKKLKGTQKILGYDCVSYRIVETKRTADGQGARQREFLIWATDAIRPALSTHAVLGFYEKVLPDHTPLQVREIPNGAKGTFGQSVAQSYQ